MHYLDFKGRVREVSPKNFQLVHWDHNRNQLGTDLVLLFGKKEHSEYALDFCYPMNALQAFALGEGARLLLACRAVQSVPLGGCSRGAHRHRLARQQARLMHHPA